MSSSRKLMQTMTAILIMVNNMILYNVFTISFKIDEEVLSSTSKVGVFQLQIKMNKKECW